VPRRLPGVDPSGILDGSDPRTEWQGFHPFTELPQIFNPPSGWLLNTNSTPFSATRDVPFERADFPPYMVGAETTNPRAVSSARVLDALRNASFDDFAGAVVDTRLSIAEEQVPLITAEWQRLNAAPADSASVGLRQLGPLVTRLAAWDRRMHAGSIEGAWFMLAFEQHELAARAGATAWPWLRALANTVTGLQARFGRSEVAWGELNRLQRPLPGQERSALDSTRASLPVHGAPSAVGSVFTFHTEGFGEIRPRRGVHGNSFVKVIEFGPEIRARSILNFGQSGDPRSPHFFDQAPIYARGEFKPAWFSLDDVARNAVRKYEVRE
jgi:acyl-homoserine-lactone acylase